MAEKQSKNKWHTPAERIMMLGFAAVILLGTILLCLPVSAADGKSVVGVFHDLNLAAELSDRIMVMNGGRTEILDSAENVCRSEKLNEIYGFDIRAYMQKTLKKWE